MSYENAILAVPVFTKEFDRITAERNNANVKVCRKEINAEIKRRRRVQIDNLR